VDKAKMKFVPNYWMEIPNIPEYEQFLAKISEYAIRKKAEEEKLLQEWNASIEESERIANIVCNCICTRCGSETNLKMRYDGMPADFLCEGCKN
jgi:hypothetical protein